MKNIAWYTRDGHLDFLARLSNSLEARGNKINSFYVCHTRDEAEHLENEYGFSSRVLAEYLLKKKKTLEVTPDIIKQYEEKYNDIPLRRIVWSEMFETKLREDGIIFHLIAHMRFWESFLVDNKIDGVVSERPSILSTTALWIVCKKLDIKFVDFINIGIDGRIVLTSSWYGDIDGFADKFKSIEIDEDSAEYAKASEYLEKMTTIPEKPEYIFKNLTTGEKISGHKLYRRFPVVGNIRKLNERIRKARVRRTYYVNGTLAGHFSSLFLMYFRAFAHRVLNVFDKNIDPTKERYFLFPLHICKEWSNYPWMGLTYPNIVKLIEEISACLPLGCKLYVKEHTTNFPERSFAFYKSIKKIERVRLVDRHEDTYGLLRNSEGIVTIGSTMGWEAFLADKPVIIFGDTWYKNLPGVYKSKSCEHLAELLQNTDKLALASKEDKLKAICSLYDIGFKAERYPVKDLISRENVEKYINSFEEWLENEVVAEKLKEDAVIK